MQSRLLLSLITAAVLLPSTCLQAAENARAADTLREPMKGLIWKVGRTGKDGPLIAAKEIDRFSMPIRTLPGCWLLENGTNWKRPRGIANGG